MSNEFNTLKDKKALIVGGTGTIGSAIASLLSRKGVKVTVTGRNKGNSDNSFIQWNFETDGIEAFESGELKQALNECDILCVCFGPFLQKSIEDMTSEEWQKITLTNYALTGFLTSSVLKCMKQRKWGRILLFGGTRTDAVRAYRTNAAYAGAKTGISVLVKSVAMEYTREGITCNAILPGIVTTPVEGAPVTSAEEIAENAYYLLNTPNLSGVLLNADLGWNF